MEQHSSRRRFLAALGTGATALWFADHLGAVEDAARHAEHAVQDDHDTQRGYEFFTPAEARTVDAIAGRIIPNDDGTPGAREAGAVYFIDRVAARYLRDDIGPLLREGLATLATDVAAKYPGTQDFASLTKEQQDALLREREATPFFDAMRTGTLAGVLSSQKYGGNRNYVGWKLVGHDPAATYQPPFGYYDRPSVRRQMLGDA